MTRRDRLLLLYWGVGGYVVGLVAGVILFGTPFLGLVGGAAGYFWGRYTIQKRRGVSQGASPGVSQTATLSEEDRAWLKEFLQMKEKGDSIVDAVQHAVQHGDAKAKGAALQRAVDEIPGIILQYDALESSKSSRLRRDTSLFIEGLKHFDYAARPWLVYLETGDDKVGREAGQAVKKATKLMRQYSDRSRAWASEQ